MWSLGRSRSRDRNIEPALPLLALLLLLLLLAFTSVACGPTPPTTNPTPPSNVATVSAPIDAPAATPTAALGANGLKVTAIDPPFGDVDGGTYAVIKGERFLADGARNVKIFFGTSSGTIVRFQSDHELIVQVPAGTLNETVDVTVVFEPGGKLKLARAFTFVARVP